MKVVWFPWRGAHPFASTFTPKGTSPPEMGFYLACLLGLLHLDKLDGRRQFTIPQPQSLFWSDRSLSGVNIPLLTFKKGKRDFERLKERLAIYVPFMRTGKGWKYSTSPWQGLQLSSAQRAPHLLLRIIVRVRTKLSEMSPTDQEGEGNWSRTMPSVRGLARKLI